MPGAMRDHREHLHGRLRFSESSCAGAWTAAQRHGVDKDDGDGDSGGDGGDDDDHDNDNRDDSVNMSVCQRKIFIISQSPQISIGFSTYFITTLFLNLS